MHTPTYPSAWLLVAAMAGAAPPPAAKAEPVVVFAAASLQEVVSDVAAAWSRADGRQARLQFESTPTLVMQLRAGAACDVFIPAAPEWLDEVAVKERLPWLGNTLVCIVPSDAGTFDIRRLASLAIGNEQVPAGKYGRAALAHAGVALPRRLVHGQSVRDVLSIVAHGGAAAGIVYATDAALDPRVRVARRFAAGSHPAIVYTAGLLTEEGRSFFAALRAPWATEMARRRGFDAPE